MQNFQGHARYIKYFIILNFAFSRIRLRSDCLSVKCMINALYITAGAEVIITNTYQASVPGFVKHLGLNEKSSYELIKEAVRIAKRAVDVYMSENPNGKVT